MATVSVQVFTNPLRPLCIEGTESCSSLVRMWMRVC